VKHDHTAMLRYQRVSSQQSQICVQIHITKCKLVIFDQAPSRGEVRDVERASCVWLRTLSSIKGSVRVCTFVSLLVLCTLVGSVGTSKGVQDLSRHNCRSVQQSAWVLVCNRV
jgi:hypothetical protein